jgi:hypothetical protein
VLLEILVLKGFQELLQTLVRLVQLVKWVLQEHQQIREQLDHKGFLEHHLALVPREQLDHKGLLEHHLALVPRDQLDHKGLLEHHLALVQREQLEQQETLVQLAQLGQLAPQV